MALIRYIIEIGVVYLIIIYSLKVIQFSVLLLLSRLVISKKTTFWINFPLHILGTYLLVSLTSKVTLIATPGQSGSLSMALYITVGMIVVYMNEANMAEATHERIQKEHIGAINWTLVKYTSIADLVLMCLGPILYGLTVFRPALLPNMLLDPILAVVKMASKVSAFSLIVKGLGIVNLVGIMMGGCLFSRRLLGSV